MPQVAALAFVAPDHTLTVRRFLAIAQTLDRIARRIEGGARRGREHHTAERERQRARRAAKKRAQAVAWREAARRVETLHTVPVVEPGEQEWEAPVARVVGAS